MKIALSGSHGFIGSHLMDYLQKEGHEVLRLVRNPQEGGIFWNPEKNELNPKDLEQIDGIINLSGENIVGRWTSKKKEAILQSRVQSSKLLADAACQCVKAPLFYIGASAIGYYGDRGEEQLTEESSAGKGFLAEVCQKWEEAPKKIEERGTRVLFSRFGIVLGRGGTLEKMVKPFKMGMGGVLGSGNQFISWIAIDDLLRAVTHLIQQSQISGAVNFVSPQPVTNREFTKTLGKVLERPTVCSIPEGALSLLLGQGSQMLLSSSYVLPKKLLDSGFNFQYPLLEEALKKYLS